MIARNPIFLVAVGLCSISAVGAQSTIPPPVNQKGNDASELNETQPISPAPQKKAVVPDVVISPAPPAPVPIPYPITARKVSKTVLNSKAISKPQPAYPPIAKASRVSGEVRVQVTVDERGRVIAAKAVSGSQLLRKAAVDAAWQAKFNPTTLSARPARVSGILTYSFQPN